MKKFLIVLAATVFFFAYFTFTAHAQVTPPTRGGTGTSTIPTVGQVLVGQSNGTYAPQATSTLGISGGAGGPATLSGGILNALTFWTSDSTVGATTAPTVGYLTGTTSATSTFAGAVKALGLQATGYVTLMGETFSNFTTYVRSLFSDTVDGLTLAAGVLSLDSGYAVPTTTRLANHDTAFGWGNHATQNYFDKDTDSTTNITEGSKLFYLDSRVLTYLNTLSKGYFFSTTSANFWETQQTARTADDLTDNQIDDLSDVAALSETNGDVLFWNGSAWTDTPTSTLGLLSTSTLNTEAKLEAIVGNTDFVTVTTNDITSANLATLLTDESGTGNAVMGTSSTLASTTLTGLTTAQTATITQAFYTPRLGVNSEYFTDLTGTGLTNTAGVLTTNCLTITGSADLCDGIDNTGGGSGGGSFSTTTSQVAGQLINYPNNATDIVAIGSNSTTSAEFWFDPNAILAYIQGKLGIGTTSPAQPLAVQGNAQVTGRVTAQDVSATNTLTIGSLTGVLKATTGLVSVATPGTDYLVTAITSLNSQTDASQSFASTTSGTDFRITSSGGVHTFQTPSASASARGFLTAADWSTFNSKADLASAMTGTFDGNNFAGGAIGSGDLLYGSGAGSIAELSIGTGGLILTSQGGLPAWTATTSIPLGGDVTGTLSATVVGNDSHDHTSATLSGIDISADTNLTVTANGLQLSGDAVALASGYAIPSTTLMTEWSGKVSTSSIDTIGEVETLWGVSNILIENDIDASSELSALVDDETGSGALVFGTNATLASTTLTGLLTFQNATGSTLTITGGVSLFGGTSVTSANAFCIQLTGTADLCDGNDGGGGGGGSISTSSVPTAGHVTFWTSPSAVSGVATGTLSETVTGLELDAARSLIGGSAVLGITSGYAIPLTASTTEWAKAYASSTLLSATSPLSYNANTGAFSIQNAAADGSTKGAASFGANDFDASSGNITIDYTNGQAASGSLKGFLTSANWTTFNSKLASTSTWTAGQLAYVVGGTGNLSSVGTTTLTATAPLSLSQAISVIGSSPSTLTCATASGSQAGCVSTTDYATWHSKVSTTSIDTIGEVETLWGVSNILIENDIDTGTELLALYDDETGTGVPVFSVLPTLSGFLSTASSTIGGGTQQTGLTVNGGATTTGNALFNSTSAATSTLYIESTASLKGGRIVLEDVDGAGCTEVTALDGVLSAKTVTCP